MSFADLGLKPELLRAVVEKGYTDPTPIQSQAIPAVLTGADILAGAQTGTGKTAAFVLPLLHKLGERQGRAPRALVLTPTRELAAQVAESARMYGRYVGIRTAVVFGGVSINPQIDLLEAGCDLLVATPGRLLDLAEQGALDLRSVQTFVLDEADRMLDMGFIPAIRRVVKLLPPQRQNLMFSATYADDIRQLAGRILRNPVNIEVAPRNSTAERVDQQIYRVPKDHKRHLLRHLIDDGNWHQVLVFTRTKHGANRLAQQLESSGIAASAIHGNKSQGARVRALADFKANKITALVATEVAARGLDIKELPHVVNFELPNVPEDYVHRIGRTARAGGTGSAVSLVSPDETPLLKDIERLLKRSLPVSALPQFEIVAQPADAVARERAPQGGGSSGDARRNGGGGQHGRGSRNGNAPRRNGDRDRSRAGAGRQDGGRRWGGGDAPRFGDATRSRDGGAGRDPAAPRFDDRSEGGRANFRGDANGNQRDSGDRNGGTAPDSAAPRFDDRSEGGRANFRGDGGGRPQGSGARNGGGRSQAGNTPGHTSGHNARRTHGRGGQHQGAGQGHGGQGHGAQGHGAQGHGGDARNQGSGHGRPGQEPRRFHSGGEQRYRANGGGRSSGRR